jgi:PPOX class probable F420-dependent enzyme
MEQAERRVLGSSVTARPHTPNPPRIGDIDMPDMQDVRSFLAQETGLAVVSTTQADGRVLSSVVNCGVIDHPVSGAPCVVLVSRGAAARIGHVRRGSQVTIAVRRGWSWVSVTGRADLIGPDDLPDTIDAEALRILLRDVYTAAGGTHDDWDEYDRAMIDDGRTAVLVSPDRILGVTPS